MTKSKMLPFLPDEKSNHACFWSLTKKDGVFSLLKGESPSTRVPTSAASRAGPPPPKPRDGPLVLRGTVG